MPRSHEELEKFLTTDLNSDAHFTGKELALLIGEFALSDELLESVAYELRSESLLERAASLIDKHRINQLIDAEYDEVFYLTPYNKDIPPKISPKMILNYIENFNPKAQSELVKLIWHTVLTNLPLDKEESVELAQFCFKKIVAVLVSPYLDRTSLFDIWLINELQNIISQLLHPTITDEFFQKVSPKCTELLHEVAHDCSKKLIDATYQHKWPEVIELIQGKNNLLQYIPDKAAITTALREALLYEEHDVVLAILGLEGDNQLDDLELLSAILEEEAITGRTDAIYAISSCSWIGNKAMIPAASQALKQAASFENWGVVLTLLNKLLTLKLEPTTSSLEHTLEHAARSGQEDVIHVILGKGGVQVDAASLARAVLYAEKNKQWHTVLTLRAAQGLARTSRKSILEATKTAERFINQERAPTPPSRLRFFEETRPEQTPPRLSTHPNASINIDDEFNMPELETFLGTRI